MYIKSTIVKFYLRFHYRARSLMKLQSLFGVIPRVYGKGAAAQHVSDMIQRMLKEQGIHIWVYVVLLVCVYFVLLLCVFIVLLLCVYVVLLLCVFVVLLLCA